jgi:alanine dehydrogenase
VRTALVLGPGRYFGLMPAYLPGPPSASLGAKLVTSMAGNQAHGLPSHLASILLLDPDTGALRAILDGRYVTEARTAAVSALSARVLARPAPGKLCLLGSGVQARSHLRALLLVRQFSSIAVYACRWRRC